MPFADRDCSELTTRLHSANDLIVARSQGRLSRRGLLRRAAELGLAAPVVGVLLHATGDLAYGAPTAQSADASHAPVAATKRTAPKGTQRTDATVIAGTVGQIDSLSPYTANLYAHPETFDVLSGVMEGLLLYDSKQRLRPTLARSYSVSDDGLVYTFNLRDDVTFHNGDDFSADDVVKTWEMIVNSDSPTWSQMGWEKIDRINVIDDLTVEVTTSEIYAPFLSYLAAGAFTGSVISPARQLRKDPERFIREFGRAPIGTGPMRFVRHSGNDIVLERNDDYWGDKPQLAGLTIRVYPDHERQIEAYEAKQVDVVSRVGTPGDPFLDRALPVDGYTVFEYAGLTWGHFDLKQIGFLRETLVRQALDLATPAQRIIDEVLGGRAYRAFADQAPGSLYYDTGLKPRDFDPERAKVLLDRAGLKVGPSGVRERDDELLEIELWGEASDLQAAKILDLVAESWNAIGIRAVAKLAPRDTLWGPMGYQFSDRMTAGYYRWSNFNDPDDMFYWHSSQIPTSPTGPGSNWPAFFFPYSFQDEIDELTSRAAAEIDPDARKQLYFQIQSLLRKEVPVLFTFWDKNYSAATEKLGNFWPSAFNYLLWNVDEWYLAE